MSEHTATGRSRGERLRAVEHLTVLLIQDVAGDLVRDVLRDASIQVRLHQRVDDAEATLHAAGDIDLVLLDLGLSDGAGLQVLDRMLAAAPHLPVVVLAGPDDDRLARVALERGAHDYVVTTPGADRLLPRIVRNAVERARLRLELDESRRQRAALARVGQMALQGPSLAVLAEAVAEAVSNGLGADHAAVIVRSGSELRVVGSTGWGEQEVPTLLGGDLAALAKEVLEEGISRVVAAPETREGGDWGLGELGGASLALTVIPGEPSAHGLLLAAQGSPRRFRPDELAFLEDMGGALGIAGDRVDAQAALRERVKELTAVASVARLVQSHPPLQAILEGVVETLLPAMQFPDVTGVEIVVDGRIESGGASPLVTEIAAPVIVAGRERGVVRVGYGEPRQLLAEERSLVATIAESVATWIVAADADQRRQDSERQVRALLEQQPGTVWTTDADLRLTSVVGTPEVTEGTDGPEVVGSSLLDIAARNDEPAPVEDAHRAALTGQQRSYSWLRDGRTWHAQVGPLRDREGRIVGVIGSATDVSDRVEQERQLEQHRRRLQGLFDHALEAIMLLDDEGHYVDANPAAVRVLGLPRGELVGRPLGAELGIEEHSPRSSLVERLRAEGRIRTERAARRKDGAEILLEVSGVADIVPGLHLLTARDVTSERTAVSRLQRSEERFRALIESASDVVAILDAAGVIRFVSPAIQRVTGYAPEDAVGSEISGWLPPEDLELILGHWSKVLKTREPIGPVVHRLYHREGGYRHVEVVYTNRLDDPAVGGVIVNLRDVTERRRAERDLAESEERFRRLTENAPDVIYRIARQPEPHFEYLSPAIEQLSGYVPEDFYRDPELAKRVLGGAGSQDSSLHTPPAPVGTTIFQLLHRDGSTRWVERRTVAVHDEHGTLTAIEGVARDVTDAKRAQEELAASEERLSRVLETMAEGLLIFDRGGRVRFANAAAERLFEADAETLRGRSHTDPAWSLADVEGQPPGPESRAVHRVLTTGEAVSGVILTRLRRDGTRIAWETNAAPVTDTAGEVDGVIVSLREVTERLAAERTMRDALDRERQAADDLRQVNAMKDGFLQAVSHELRTPLTSVLGFGMLLRRYEELPRDQVAQLIERLVFNARRLQQLLTDLLDVDRLTRGVIHANRSTTDVEVLLQRTLEGVEGATDRVTVRCDVATADLDGPRTERIVENLVANALRHAEGPVELQAQHAEEGLLISVSDQGDGVPDHLKRVLFEPFQQGDTPASRVGGAGIGLTVVRTFAELHGGRAWVEDNPGGGAVFRVLLPDAAHDASAAVKR